jgi:hypothetical protein
MLIFEIYAVRPVSMSGGVTSRSLPLEDRGSQDSTLGRKVLQSGGGNSLSGCALPVLKEYGALTLTKWSVAALKYWIAPLAFLLH